MPQIHLPPIKTAHIWLDKPQHCFGESKSIQLIMVMQKINERTILYYIRNNKQKQTHREETIGKYPRN